jgi:hypothetical protein
MRTSKESSLPRHRYLKERMDELCIFPHSISGGWNMRQSLFIAAVIGVIAAPAFAEDVGVRVGPVGAGVTVGETHDHDRDRDRTTVIKEREPTDRTTVIKKQDEDGNRSKTIIHHDND